jgi:ferritin-like metal-binding protein YciE
MATIDEQLHKYLTDVHAIEEQALAQMKAAPDIAGDPVLAEIFHEHLHETEEQARLVRRRLEAHGQSTSKLKDAIGRVTGVPFVLFARSQPDTPGKLVAHAISYENMELAAYELLARVAERAGDPDTVEVAEAIGGQERAMSDRLRENVDRAVEASLAGADPADKLPKYLADAHAIEAQAIEMMKRAPKIAGEPELERIYAGHLEESRRHQELIEQRLSAVGGKPNVLKDAAMRLGALNWGGFFAAQPDTPAKLAGFSFAFEHLEIGGYEQLQQVAARAGDEQTVRVVESILEDEREMALRVAGTFDRALDAALEAQGVAVPGRG